MHVGINYRKKQVKLPGGQNKTKIYLGGVSKMIGVYCLPIFEKRGPGLMHVSDKYDGNHVKHEGNTK